MSGLLVIAELEAFRTVLSGAAAGDSEKIKLWSRSTVANALHRVGPIERLRPAADRAWRDADAFADRLASACSGEAGTESARDKAMDAVGVLIETIRALKDANKGTDHDSISGAGSGAVQ